MGRSLFSILAAAVTVGGMFVVVCGARLVVRLAGPRARLVSAACLLAYGAVLVVRPSPWPIIDAAVLIGSVGGVLLLERGLRTPGSVAAFLVVAAVVDVVSISGGLSRVLIDRYVDGTSSLLLYLTLVVPIGGRAVPIVGIGDLFVGGAAATALLRLGLRPLAVMGAISTGLLVALAYGLWRGGAAALPFIAVAVLLLVWRHGKARDGAGGGPP